MYPEKILQAHADRIGIFAGRRCPNVHFPDYENMPIQIYWTFYHQKMKKTIQIKNSNIFHISG